MAISVFLSRPNPATQNQASFMESLVAQMQGIGLEAKTVGSNEYGLAAPLSTIRMLMSEANGSIVVALRRYRAESLYRLSSSGGAAFERKVERTYLTSPWCQIEPGMAFQLGLPLLLIREQGVLADGVLEPGIAGLYMPEVDIETDPTSYLNSAEWSSLLHEFGGQVRAFRTRRGLT